MLDDRKIGNRIQHLRKMRGFTQEEIANKLNIGDRVKISRIETGKQSMTANEMIKFCELLGISLDNLISNKKLLSEDFMGIAERYTSNNLIPIVERKDVIKKLYTDLASQELKEIDMYSEMNKTEKISHKCSEFNIEKYDVDDIM